MKKQKPKDECIDPTISMAIKESMSETHSYEKFYAYCMKCRVDMPIASMMLVQLPGYYDSENFYTPSSYTLKWGVPVNKVAKFNSYSDAKKELDAAIERMGSAAAIVTFSPTHSNQTNCISYQDLTVIRQTITETKMDSTNDTIK